MEKMKIIFLGTPQIAVPLLEYLINKDDIEVMAVITQPDKPSGRGKYLSPPPIKIVAEEFVVPVYQPLSIRKDKELINILKNLEPDFLVTFAFGQILSQEIIDIPKYYVINIHASLLPKYRGANPIQAPIINGDKITGITSMITELGVDSGPIVMQKEIEITENMTGPELAEIIATISPEFLYESIKGLKDGIIKPIPQNNQESTNAPKITKEKGLIDWSLPGEKIHNLVRAYKSWPSAYTFFNSTCIKIIETRLDDEENVNSGKYGEIVGKINCGIKVITGDGTLIITRIQPSCKCEMDSVSWYNGARVKKGDFFEFCPIRANEL
jgi:methionyl-tRNA formyltransferase